MTQYKLVNPTIIGSLNTTIKSDTPDKAIEKLWKNVSEHLVGNVPNLLVTIREDGTKNLFHYNIKEKVNSTKEAEISYNYVDVKLSTKDRDNFLGEADKVKSQRGSGDDKDGDGDEDDDGDRDKHKNKHKDKHKDKNKKKKRNRYDDDKDDSDSSESESESEDEYYKFMKFRKNTPISMYWYTPSIYASTGTFKIYTPVWRYPIIPYNEIWIPKIF
jgi:hypothetical protein